MIEPMAKSPAKSGATGSNVWKQRYDLAANHQESMFNAFARYYKLFYAAVSTTDIAPWRSKVFVPLLANKGWEMLANIQSMQPGFEVGLYGDALLEEGAQDRADKAQWKLEHDWDNPEFDESMSDKLFPAVADSLVVGTGIGKSPWRFETKVRYEHPVDDLGQADITTQDKIETDVGYNDFEAVDVFDLFIAPGAKNLYSSPWVIIRGYATYDDLQGVNDNNDKPVYMNLDKVKDLKSTSDRWSEQKRSRNQLIGSDDPVQTDTTVDQFEVFECYEKNGYICTFAVGNNADGKGSWIKIREQKNPYWHGKYPLIPFYLKKRPHQFWGQGIFELNETLQAAGNSLVNHTFDGLNLSNNPMIAKQEADEHNYIVEPGGEYEYKNSPPTPFKFPSPDFAGFNVMMGLINQNIEESTISTYATGTPNSATDHTNGTATGIMKLQEAAGTMIAYQKGGFQRALKMLGEQWLSNNQQFMDSPTVVQGMDNNRPGPVTVQPSDLQAPLMLRINPASMEPMSKDEQRAQFQAYLQQMMGIQQAALQQTQMTRGMLKPIYLDFATIAQELSEKFGQFNYDKLIMSNDEVQQLEQQAAQQFAQTGINPFAPLPQMRVNVDPSQIPANQENALMGNYGVPPGQQPSQQVIDQQVSADHAQMHQNGELGGTPAP